MAEPLPSLEDECFFIAPIGEEGTEIRNRSDGVMNYIVKPAASAVGLTTVRADTIAKPGQITRQVIEHVVGAKAAVVDLTGANANVYYEMAVRHTAQLPTVLIAREGEKLPFDISQMRTIFFDHQDLKSAAECSGAITEHLKEAIGGEVDSPISASVAVQRLETGTPQDKVLAQLSDGMDLVLERLARLDVRAAGGPRLPISRGPARDMWAALDALEHALGGSPDPENAAQALSRGVRALRYLEGNPPRDRARARGQLVEEAARIAAAGSDEGNPNAGADGSSDA